MHQEYVEYEVHNICLGFTAAHHVHVAQVSGHAQGGMEEWYG